MGVDHMSILTSISIFSEYHSNVFVEIALLITIGIIGGKLAEIVRLPKVTGYIIIGIIFGPSVLNFFSDEMLVQFKTLKLLALGFIGYNVGLEVDFKILRNNRNTVLYLTLAQSIFTFVLVAGAIVLFIGENDWIYALILGAIATVTTPAPIIATIKTYHAKGRVTDLLFPMIALDDVLGVILFAMVLPISVFLAGSTSEVTTLSQLLAQPVFEIVLAVIIGLIIGGIVVKILNYYYKGDNVSILIIVIIGLFFGIGLSYMIGTSIILLPLTIGAVLANSLNLDIKEKVRRNTDAVILPLLLVFFTLSGAELDIQLLPSIGILGLVYIVVRVIGKVFASTVTAKALKENKNVSNYLGFALIPQGGVAIDMAILAEIRFLQLASETGNQEYVAIGSTILTVVLGAVVIYKLFGEIIVKWAFKKSGDIKHEDHEAHSHII